MVAFLLQDSYVDLDSGLMKRLYCRLLEISTSFVELLKLETGSKGAS